MKTTTTKRANVSLRLMQCLLLLQMCYSSATSTTTIKQAKDQSRISSHVNNKCNRSFASASAAAAWNLPRGGSGDPLSTRTAPSLVRPPTAKSQPQQQSAVYISSPTTAINTKQVLDDAVFQTRDSRTRFIARVYAIVAGQLAVTTAMILLFGTNPQLRNMILINYKGAAIIPWISLAISTFCWFSMAMSPPDGWRRHHPRLKWSFLTIFTLGEAVSVAFITSFYTLTSVVMTLLATIVATTSVAVYTVRQNNPKYDLSQWGATLSSCGLVFLTFGLVQLLQLLNVLPRAWIPLNDLILGVCGACLFTVYLAHHTRLVVGGKHAKYQMNEHDHVWGAMTLYNDIINLFIYLLRLIGEDRDD